jgi:hypothetical protein
MTLLDNRCHFTTTYGFFAHDLPHPAMSDLMRSEICYGNMQANVVRELAPGGQGSSRPRKDAEVS